MEIKTNKGKNNIEFEMKPKEPNSLQYKLPIKASKNTSS